MSLTGMVAAYAASLDLDRVPLEVRTKAIQALRDHLACAIAGSRTELGVLVRRILTAGIDGPARLVGASYSTLPGLAAFCNATAANAMDFDDTSGPGHPGSSIIPAALAATTITPCDGRRFLTAIVAGYEVGMRVARAIQPSWARYQQVHGIGSAQVFGAAAAAGHIFRLGEEAMARAFGIAGSIAPVPHAGKFGWDERPLTWLKDNVAWPAEAGLRAALLAQAGWPASRTILDGERGFWVMAGSDRFDPSILENRTDFELTRLSFKPYPCCRWLHTTLGALDRLQAEHALLVDVIERVRVDTILSMIEQFMDPAPQTMVDAQFSLPHAVSMKLLGVDVAEWWLPANRTRPEVLKLMARVEGRHDPALTERYLAAGRQSGRIPARVHIWVAGGLHLEAFSEVALGEPDNPLSESALLDKFRRLTRNSLDEDTRRVLVKRLAAVETLDLVEELLDALPADA